MAEERYILMRADYEQRNYQHLYEYATPLSCVGQGSYAIEIVRIGPVECADVDLLADAQVTRLARGMEHRGGWENGKPVWYGDFKQAERVAREFSDVLRPAIGFDIWGRRIASNIEGGTE